MEHLRTAALGVGKNTQAPRQHGVGDDNIMSLRKCANDAKGGKTCAPARERSVSEHSQFLRGAGGGGG